MQATLVTGETIELIKDCLCKWHDGPHWVAVLDDHKRRVTQLLHDDNYNGHISAALLYLETKEREMLSRNIHEIIR